MSSLCEKCTLGACPIGYNDRIKGTVYQCSWYDNALEYQRIDGFKGLISNAEFNKEVTDMLHNSCKNPNSKHYELWNDFESIDAIENILTFDEYVGFLKGNILKYQLRLGKKDDVLKEKQKIKDYQRELNSILGGKNVKR